MLKYMCMCVCMCCIFLGIASLSCFFGYYMAQCITCCAASDMLCALYRILSAAPAARARIMTTYNVSNFYILRAYVKKYEYVGKKYFQKSKF